MYIISQVLSQCVTGCMFGKLELKFIPKIYLPVPQSQILGSPGIYDF